MFLVVAETAAASTASYWVPAVITAVGSIVGGLVSYFGGKSTNRENLDYAESVNEESWERSKISLQTKVADAEKAGLSPLAALGSSGSQLVTPAQYQAQVPQMDLSQMISSLTSMSNEFNRNEALKEMKDADVKSAFRVAMVNAKSLEHSTKISVESAQKINDDNLKQHVLDQQQALNIANANRQLAYDQLNQHGEEVNANNMLMTAERTADSLKNWSERTGVRIEFREFPLTKENQKNYWQKLQEINEVSCWQPIESGEKAFAEWAENATPEDYLHSFSRSKGYGESYSESDAKNGGINGGVTGLGSLGANGGYMTSDGYSTSENDSLSWSKNSDYEKSFYQSFFGKSADDNHQTQIVYYYPSARVRTNYGK